MDLRGQLETNRVKQMGVWADGYPTVTREDSMGQEYANKGGTAEVFRSFCPC